MKVDHAVWVWRGNLVHSCSDVHNDENVCRIFWLGHPLFVVLWQGARLGAPQLRRLLLDLMTPIPKARTKEGSKKVHKDHSPACWRK